MNLSTEKWDVKLPNLEAGVALMEEMKKLMKMTNKIPDVEVRLKIRETPTEEKQKRKPPTKP